MRDDFSEEVKRTVAARVGYRCSRPACRALTSGPQVDPAKALNVGVAAHITAASPGGPRYDPARSAEERRHANNAIWLCQTCGKLVDNDQTKFTEVELRQWKRNAEAEALTLIGKTEVASVETSRPSWPKSQGVYITESSETIPGFPRVLVGYRSENSKDFWGGSFACRGTLRLFDSHGWAGISDFPNTMNGCSAGVFMIRWRAAHPDALIASTLGYSPELILGETKIGSFGYMYSNNCEQPLFRFADSPDSNESTLVDIYYELKFWQATP